MVAIIVAMDKELQLLLPLIQGCRTEVAEGHTYYRGTIRQRQVVVTKCGIGKVNSALGADALIRHYAPEVVFNTGVAGGTGAGAKILDVVVGERIAYHDVWCGPGTVWGEAAGCPLYFESDATWLADPALAPSSTLHKGLVCSGDIFVDSPAVVAAIKERFPDVIAIDMESASIAQTCYRHGVPFVCLRVLSDTPGAVDDNISQYTDFWDQAPERTFSILNRLLAGN